MTTYDLTTGTPLPPWRPKRPWPEELRTWADDNGWCPYGDVVVERLQTGPLSKAGWLRSKVEVGYYKNARTLCTTTSERMYFSRRYYYTTEPDARANSIYYTRSLGKASSDE